MFLVNPWRVAFPVAFRSLSEAMPVTLIPCIFCPFADKRVMSLQLECMLTATRRHAKNRLLDSWLIHNASLVGLCFHVSATWDSPRGSMELVAQMETSAKHVQSSKAHL